MGLKKQELRIPCIKPRKLAFSNCVTLRRTKLFPHSAASARHIGSVHVDVSFQLSTTPLMCSLFAHKHRYQCAIRCQITRRAWLLVDAEQKLVGLEGILRLWGPFIDKLCSGLAWMILFCFNISPATNYRGVRLNCGE